MTDSSNGKAAGPRKVPFTSQEKRQVIELLRQRHGANLDAREKFTVDGHLSHGNAWAQIKLADPDEDRVVRLEARIDIVENDIQNPTDARDLILDFLDEVLVEYFEKGRDLRFDLEWKVYERDGHELEFCGSDRNLKLEKMADDWLAQHGGVDE